ncbi:MAG: tetratricopeptide repeat protein [Blastocatellia bacterium]|jgi:tetratricopeptide (TPR) repeat protein|nr:tetratricopeptide repeat protein [Blastocatellia bacterium]
MYNRAIALAREYGARSDEGRTIGNLGLTYEEWGKYDLAERHFAEALEILREIGNRREEAIVLANLGSLVATHGRYEEGLRYAREAYDIHVEVENLPYAAFVLGTVGACLHHLGRLDEAESALNESLDRLRAHGHERGVAMVSFEVGQLAIAQGRDARPYLATIEVFIASNGLAPDSHAGKQAAILRASIASAGGSGEKS